MQLQHHKTENKIKDFFCGFFKTVILYKQDKKLYYKSSEGKKNNTVLIKCISITFASFIIKENIFIKKINGVKYNLL